MDVHRSRFIPHPTPSITALAFSRPHDLGIPGPKPDLRLALGRSNGGIEIWNPLNGVWTQETAFPSAGDSAVDGLVWTQDPDERGPDDEVILGQHRLFSIGASPAVTEWDLQTGTVKKRSTGNFAEVWCLAAQPRWRPVQKAKEAAQQQTRAQDLVAGCGDGTLVLLSTEDNDLQFKRFLARVAGKKARCLTVAYQKPEVVVAGFADSMIRVFDTRNGSLMRNLSLGVGVPGAPKTALVWKVSCLQNGDIVSADSNGMVRIWDGKTYSMTQRLRGHDGDCLDVVSSSDGKSLLSCGVDGRMACYRQSVVDRGRTSWAKISHRRIHQGQGPVKSLAAYDSKGVSVVICGGGDPAPVVVPLKEFGRENIRSLPFLPQQAKVVSAPKARLIASWWDKTILVYRMARQNSLEVLSDELRGARKLVAKIALKTDEHIRSVAISQHGNVLAASTTSEIKVFQLRKRSWEEETLSVRRVKIPDDLADSGARLLAFSNDGNWLAAVTPDSEAQIARLDSVPEQPKLLRVLDRVIELDRPRRVSPHQSGFRDYDRTIMKVAFSEDDKVLVAGDVCGYLDSWVLQGDMDPSAPAIDVYRSASDDAEGSSDPDSDSDSDSSDDDDDDVAFYGQRWTDNSIAHVLPKLDSAPLVLTFRPSTTPNDANGTVQASHRLLVITARHQVYEFDLTKGRLTDWSRRNPTSALPPEFTRIRDRVMDAVWDGRGRVWLYGASFVFMLDVAKDIAAGEQEGGKKRKRAQKGEEDVPQSKRMKDSGAGDRIRGELAKGAPEKVRRVEAGEVREINLTARDRSEDEGEGEEEEVDLRLARSGDAGEADGQDLDEEAQQQLQQQQKALTRAGDKGWWCTFRYRPILGMVALSGAAMEAEDEEGVLEVVIVERPVVEIGEKAAKK